MPPRPPAVFRAVMRLTVEVVTLLRGSLQSRAALAAENLSLRKQLALYRERQAKPRRADPATRAALMLLAQVVDSLQSGSPAYELGARPARTVILHHEYRLEREAA